MKESHRKGVANHPDPESCAGNRKVVGEALTGEHAGQPLSCEIRQYGTPRQLTEAEGNIERGAKCKPPTSPAQSKTLCMRESSLYGNWETPRTPDGDGTSGRSGKAKGRTPDAHERGESDSRVVPKKPPNKDGPKRTHDHGVPYTGTKAETPDTAKGKPTVTRAESNPLAEVVEGRRLVKGNVCQPTAPRTQSRTSASSGLTGVREAARRNKKMRFTALLHHVTRTQLESSFDALKRNAAPGVDGMTWAEYEKGLAERLRKLHETIHRGTYRARPSRRTYIPKADGRMRPLGIAALEDKIVQHAVGTVLNGIYEQDFLGFSYGFRPRRGTHDALDALWMGITTKTVRWVLDADIRGFFDTINHEWLMKFIEHRVADRRVLRLIRKWLKAGALEDGKVRKTEVGTPQGAVISPLLANVYLHYVLDLWVEHWRKTTTASDVVIVRYADDFVMGFQRREDAEQFLKELRLRMEKFGLELHPDKTRLIEFGRYAAENRAERGEGKPQTFDFLGFTHICGVKRERKGYILKRKTCAKRLRAKLKQVRDALMRIRHFPIPEQGRWLAAVVRGHCAYFAVPLNSDSLGEFRTQCIRHWRFALRRRSQRNRMTWERMNKLAKRWIPTTRILHPHPNERFYAKHPR